jgi:thiol-disulfide isomerase/thioredoxin
MRLAGLLLIIPLLTFAQKQEVLDKGVLSVGDKLPAITINNVLNGNDSSISLSPVEGKATIIEFWATWCTSCIASIKTMDSLEKQFNGELSVLLVTSQPASEVEPFLRKNKVLSRNRFPVITSDSLLRQMFPHATVPHTVWIDKTGTVKAITAPGAITAKNLSDLLAGRKLDLPLKKEILDYDPGLPLLVNNNGGEGAYKFSSTLSGFLPGMNKRAYFRKLDQGQKIIYINHSIPELYQMALSTSFDNRLVIDAGDKLRFVKPKVPGNWEKDHCYSYELFAPSTWSRKELGQKMMEDLDRYFRLSVKKEKRKLKCYVITNKENGIGLYRTKGGKPLQGKDDNGVFRIRNKPIAVLIKELNRMQAGEPFQKPIILNETGYEGNIDMNITASLYPGINIEHLRKDLNAVGLDLQPADREIEVFVINETKDN